MPLRYKRFPALRLLNGGQSPSRGLKSSEALFMQ